MATPVEARILVVESDAAARRKLQSMLVRHGYRARPAENIAAALAAFDAEPCPLAITAAALPDGLGADLILALRQRAPDVAVILVGKRSWKAILAALHSAAADYLPTPLRDADLLAALERARAAQTHADRALIARIAELEASQASLAQVASLAALGRLAANLAHEINNPLTPIFGMTELLLDDLPADHIGRPYAEAISTAAQRIRDVVRSLIDFARPAAQEYAWIELGPLIHDTLLLTEQQLHDQRIATVIRLPPDPLAVLGSAAQLKQALLLLIDNAREAMANGGQLTISLFAEPAPGADRARRAVIAIDDTGVGISAQRIPLIFEPFYSTKPQVVGVGLGLAVARGIVQEHGGEIEVDSTPRRGSSFRIALPAAA